MLRQTIGRWWRRCVALIEQQRGQGLVEYGLIIALVAIVAIGGITAFSSTMNNTLYSLVILGGLSSVGS